MKENLVKSALQLLEARKAALEQMQRTTMKAHGKIQGKDWFTWLDAHPKDLCNTLETLPYPVIWVVGQKEFQSTVQYTKLFLENVASILLFGEKGIFNPVIETNKAEVFETMELALQKLEGMNLPKAVVLINIQSSVDENAMGYLNNFLSSKQH